MRRPSQGLPWQHGRSAPGRPSQKIEEVREAREKADAEKRRLLDRLKEQRQAETQAKEARTAALEAKRSRLKSIDVDAALNAARRLKFFDLVDSGAVNETKTLNRPSLTLLELYLHVLRDRNSISVLQWPHDISDVSSLHPLAMVAALCSVSENITAGFRWCPAIPDIRSLYFPWRGHGTGVGQRRTLLERAELMKRNALHLTRTQFGEPEYSPEFAKLHIMLGHLNHLKVRDESKPHLAHPTLGELYPTFGALGGDNAPPLFRSPVYELFGRVAHGAALNQLQDHRGSLVQPATAPFALFGICPRANVKAALNHAALTKGRGPDACILDLNSPGLSRLGPSWDRDLQAFLELLVATHPETPVLSVTQDIFVHRRISFLLGKLGLSDRSTATSRVIVRSTDDLFTPDPEIGEVSEVKFQFHSTAGQGAAALRALSDAARQSSDPVVAGVLRNAMGSVRRTMSLPCGLKRASDTLVETEGQEAAEAFLERRSASSVLAVIKRQIELCADSSERARLTEAERTVDKAFEEFEQDTPIGSLLAELAASLSRKSSQSVIAFAREEDRILGEGRICDDTDQGASIRKRIESGYMRLATLQDLDEELASIEAGRTRNMWKRLVVVAPPRNQFAVMLGRRWLPEEIIVLSDREFVEKLAGTYQTLSSHPDLAGPGDWAPVSPLPLLPPAMKPKRVMSRRSTWSLMHRRPS